MEVEKKLTYERPEVEVINVILDHSILDNSGDGTVVGPGDEIPD